MNRYRVGVLLTVALFGAAVVAGLIVARRFGPDRLHAEVERQLSAALGTPVRVGRMRVSPGTFVHIEGHELTAWPSDGGYGLEIDRVSGSVDAISVITGQVELARLRISGATLRLSGLGDAEQWSPLGDPGAPKGAGSSPPQPDELLSPLISLETLARRILSPPHAASVVELEEVRISFEDDLAPDRGRLAFEGVTGRIAHRRFSRRSEFSLEARLSEGETHRGSLVLGGRREPDDSIQISLNADELELASGARYLRGVRPDAQISGRLSGEWLYETPEPGTGRLQATLTFLDLVSSVPGAGRGAAWIRSPRIDFVGTLQVDPQSATLDDFQIANYDTSLRVSGQVSRPLQRASRARLELQLENLDLGQARHLIGWLPEIEREEAAAVVAPLTSGRLDTLRATGSATLSAWQAFLAGRSRRVPNGFSMEARLADMVAEFGDANRLENLTAKLRWIGDRLEIEGATAALNGETLPVLDATIDGFPNFLAGDPTLREMESTALPLSGLSALWDAVRPRPDSISAEIGTRIEIDFDHLAHPLFLWPLRDVSATIVAQSDGVRIDAEDAVWAGVPVTIGGEWRFQPEERISLQLGAARPSDASVAPQHRDPWARGRFHVGELLGGRWQHRSARGSFAASRGEVRLREVDIDLAPEGRARADGVLDVSIRGAVPFRVNFGVVDSDGSAVGELVGLPAGQIEGRMNLDGSFEGVLRPETSFFTELNGLLDITAFDGAIRKHSPSVVAIAEAAAQLDTRNPTEPETPVELPGTEPTSAADDSDDLVRFDRVETMLEFSGGRMHSASFSLDGPKLAVVASGDLELAVENKTIDAQVYVFLFRRLDRMIGKIPILNRMLLGTDENLVATAFDVSGEWADPQVKAILLPSSAGPASQVLQGVPLFVMRGIRALGALVKPTSSETRTPPASSEDPGGGIPL